jgi:hypothetical protein
MLFAMSSPVADCIAGLTMQQVRAVASRAADSLRVRWQADMRFWRELLIAAKDKDETTLRSLRRQAKLHFAGELVHIEPA